MISAPMFSMKKLGPCRIDGRLEHHKVDFPKQLLTLCSAHRSRYALKKSHRAGRRAIRIRNLQPPDEDVRTSAAPPDNPVSRLATVKTVDALGRWHVDSILLIEE